MQSPEARKAKSPLRPTKSRHDVRSPSFLYHATPAKNFQSISEQGLLPVSRGEKGVRPYVSFAENPRNTPVLSGNKPSDIIFRVATRRYKIFKGGAGKGEYRTNSDVSPVTMSYVERKELNQKPVPWKRVGKGQSISFV